MTAVSQQTKFFKIFKSIDEKKYAKINRDRLVPYAVHLLEENGFEPTFEKVVAAAFRLFPETFSLLGFPMYPDARMIYYSLWHCVDRSKGWLSGNVTSGYHVMPKGKKIVSETLDALLGKIYSPKKVASRQKRKELYFLELVEKSGAFRKYIAGKRNEMSEAEIRVMLMTRKDTPVEIIARNLNKFLEYAKLAEKQNIVEFLEFVKNSPRMKHLAK